MNHLIVNFGIMWFPLIVYLINPLLLIRPVHAKFKNDFQHKQIHQNPRFLSFNSHDSDKIEIDLDLSIPFLSIPLTSKEQQGGYDTSLANVNTKALTIAGLITSLAVFMIPLFVKGYSSLDRRSGKDIEWNFFSDAINDMVYYNNYISPCVQRAICSIVSKARHSNNPTSSDKIIDGISSHWWFNSMTNGTIIQNAVVAGRNTVDDCSSIYSGCFITPRLLTTFLKNYGIL
ncbi:uncharacterized protein LOC107265808 [Cephus cinctus]|uniref:Uncharacterized protein LOC107265808 n=1 Tax=Cephus cinctus TaxID=211228 RepID=A0AAJ7VZE9_CEPCN|nr:uncharacterized protein LOC107265808 [Cephus cinctus]